MHPSTAVALFDILTTLFVTVTAASALTGYNQAVTNTKLFSLSVFEIEISQESCYFVKRLVLEGVKKCKLNLRVFENGSVIFFC